MWMGGWALSVSARPAMGTVMQMLDGQRMLDERGLDYFRTASVFGALTDEAIRFLLTCGRVLAVADGEELFHPGEPGDGFFIVIEGQLDYVREREGSQVAIRTIAMGEQLGYVSMIGLFERFGVGRAHGQTIVLEITVDLFHQLHTEYPFDFGILMLNLSRDMARTIREMASRLTEARLRQQSA